MPKQELSFNEEATALIRELIEAVKGPQWISNGTVSLPSPLSVGPVTPIQDEGTAVQPTSGKIDVVIGDAPKQTQTFSAEDVTAVVATYKLSWGDDWQSKGLAACRALFSANGDGQESISKLTDATYGPVITALQEDIRVRGLDDIPF